MCLNELLFLPYFLFRHLVGVVRDQFPHPADHIVGQFPFDELAIDAYSSNRYQNYWDGSHYKDDGHVHLAGLFGFVFVAAAVDAVLWGLFETFADGLDDLVGVEVASVDHIVDSDLWETVET